MGTGGQDVGEPRRSSSILHSPLSPIKRPFVPLLQNLNPSRAYFTQSTALHRSSISPIVSRIRFHFHNDPRVHIPLHVLFQITRIAPNPTFRAARNRSVRRKPPIWHQVTWAQSSRDSIGRDEYSGTPREPAPRSKPRFLALGGVRLDSDIPWAFDSNLPTGMNDARQSLVPAFDQIREQSKRKIRRVADGGLDSQSPVEFGQRGGPGQEQPYPEARWKIA